MGGVFVVPIDELLSEANKNDGKSDWKRWICSQKSNFRYPGHTTGGTVPSTRAAHQTAQVGMASQLNSMKNTVDTSS